MKLDKFICEVCGCNEYTIKGSMVVCSGCGTSFRQPADSADEQAKEERLLRIVRQEDAESDLRMSPPNFDLAEDKFNELIRQYPTWTVGYWGALRAKYGIKYVVDVDGKSIPSCYKSEYKDFRGDPYFCKVLEIAETEDLRAKYTAEGDRIAQTCTEWREKASRFDYDVFISFKATEDGAETKDLREMQDLYTYLTEQGYKVFFSPVSMRSIVGRRDWDAYIFNALEKASVLILYGSHADYFTTPWVENEWTRYLRMIRTGKKNPNSLIVAYEGFDPATLHRLLRERQALNAADKTFYITLTERIQEILAADPRKQTIDRISVKRTVGRKVANISETIQIAEAGVAKSKKENAHIDTRVAKRDIAVSSGVYTFSQRDTLQMGLNCLSLSAFEEAEMFFNECLVDNKTDGAACLALLCVKLRAPTLYAQLTEGKVGTEVDLKDADALLSSLPELTGAIEHAPTKEIASSILRYLYVAFCNKFSARDPRNLDTLFSFILRYDSAVYDKTLSTVTTNMATVCDICAPAVCDSIFDELLQHITDADKFTAVATALADEYRTRRAFEKASLYNQRVLDVDPANLLAITNKLYFAFGADGPESFLSASQSDAHKVAEMVSYLAEVISGMTREDAEELLNRISDVELYCMGQSYFASAELYFDFAYRYKFPRRNRALERHRAYLSRMDSSFFDKYLSVMAHESVDWHIETRLKYADELRGSARFAEAEAFYTSVLALDEGNTDALLGMLLSDIKHSQSDAKNIQWERFSVPQLEKVLSSCVDVDKQTAVLSQLCEVCISTVASAPTPCLNAFDQIIRYFHEDASAVTFRHVSDLAATLLSISEFVLATKYASLVIADNPNSPEARFVILLASLRCRTKEEFIHHPDFDKNMPEYKLLLFSCKDNPALLQEYVRLAKDNEKYLADSEAQRIHEAARRATDLRDAIAMRKRILIQNRALRIKCAFHVALLLLLLCAAIAAVVGIIHHSSVGDIIGGQIATLIVSLVLIVILARTCSKDRRAAAEYRLRVHELNIYIKLNNPKPRRKLSKNGKLVLAVLIPVLVACVIAGSLYPTLIVPTLAYNDAKKLANAGDYLEAIDMFESLGDFADSMQCVTACYYGYAIQCYNAGDYSTAYNIFNDLGSYEDSRVFADLVLEQYLSNSAKYKYVTSHPDPSDELAYRFLRELCNKDYSNAYALYDMRYPLNVECNINTSSSISSHNQTTFSHGDPIFLHIRISDGTPDKAFTVSINNIPYSYHPQDNGWMRILVGTAYNSSHYGYAPISYNVRVDRSCGSDYTEVLFAVVQPK